MGEALTQGIVLAVVRRLAGLCCGSGGMGLGFGNGVVVVGAGVRVLFAVGVRLRGVEDLNEFVWGPLRGLVG